jgi:rfaE bifunctional protein kinase chain/domain
MLHSGGGAGRPADILPTAEDLRRLAGAARISFVSGNFNVVHPGHLRLLRFAAEHGDFLVVGVNPDAAPGVTLPAEMRLEGVEAIAMVDQALVLHEPLEVFLAKLRPEVVVKGKEFETRGNIERAAVEGYGGKLLFSAGEVRFSSLNLLRRQYTETDFASIEKPLDYPVRHGFEPYELKEVLGKLAGLRVLVIGDLIVDRYVECEPLGMSREDPTLVVTPLSESTFVGGAGIVAAHAQGLGAECRFLSVVGDDAAAEFAREVLAGYGVAADLLIDGSRPTTLKRRYRAQGKTLLRVNELRQHAVDAELAGRLVAQAAEHLASTDLILFSDFNYGCLPQSVVDALVAMAHLRKVSTAADSQASSQLADISRFRGMDLITPTEREARLALRDFESGLAVIVESLQQRAKARTVIVTLGAEGLLCFAEKEGEYRTDRLPAFNTSPKDVAGAGDSLFASTALALRAGVDPWRSTYLGSLAAACQVSRVGNAPITREDLAAELEDFD